MSVYRERPNLPQVKTLLGETVHFCLSNGQHVYGDIEAVDTQSDVVTVTKLSPNERYRDFVWFNLCDVVSLERTVENE